MENLTNISNLIVQELRWVPNRAKKGWFSCPKHIDKSPSLHVDYERGLYHCFSCNQGGSLLTLFYEEKGQSAFKYFEIENTYTRKPNLLVKTALSEDTLYKKPPIVRLTLDGSYIKASKSDVAIEWAKSRGFPLSALDNFNMYFSKNVVITDTVNLQKPLEERQTKFDNRILIPIKEAGKLISFEGRSTSLTPSFDNKVIKSLYPKGSSLKTLYDFDKLNKKEPLYLVEGLMDLIALRTHPKFKNSTTIFGASIADRQHYLLNKFDKIIYIINNDDAGKRSLDNLKKNFKGELLYLLPPPHCGDVNDIIHPQHLNSTLEEQINKGWSKRLSPCKS